MNIEKQLRERGFIDEDNRITVEGIEVLINTPHFKEKPMPEDLREGLEFQSGNGTIHIHATDVHNEDHTIACRSIDIWTEEEEPEEGCPCFLKDKEDIIALRDYLNRFLEEFFE